MPRTGTREAAARDDTTARAGNGLADPLPVLVIAREPDSLAPLRQDRRFEIVTADSISPAWISLSRHIAGTVIWVERDPFDSLTYAVTAGLRDPILVMQKRHARLRRDLLDAGALDCETVPLTRRALDRMVTLLRARTAASRVNPLVRLVLDPIARTARHGARCIPLSQRQFALLHCLDAAGGRAVSAESLLTEVWGDRTVGRTRTILEVYVCLLRRKLDALGMRGTLATVRHYGYCLGPPAASPAGTSADTQGAAEAPANTPADVFPSAPPPPPALTPAAAARRPRRPARPGSTAR